MASAGINGLRDSSKTFKAPKPIRIRWALFQFEAVRAREGFVLSRIGRTSDIVVRVYERDQEEVGRQWLGDMGLDSRQARRLLDAALRGVGPFANVEHPRRVSV